MVCLMTLAKGKPSAHSSKFPLKVISLIKEVQYHAFVKTPCREDGGACFTKDGSISKVEKKEDKEEEKKKEKKKKKKNKRSWRRGEGGERQEEASKRRRKETDDLRPLRRWYAERNGDVTTAIVVTFIAEPKVQGAERTESKDYVLAYFFELHAGKFHRELRTRKRRDLMPVNISGNLKRSSLHE
uniref:Uncharacterized protein n=1 Tax=Vespula pensylvanica TaxID=30213 RepID=A0A834UDP1_VESPE|nr:hypothetical protein H0235_005166 [Vespula pensylvanica]